MRELAIAHKADNQHKPAWPQELHHSATLLLSRARVEIGAVDESRELSNGSEIIKTLEFDY